jgi:RNA polymerase sigma-B factor
MTEPTERERLITENLGLARMLSRRFSRRGVPDEDLFQVASLALVKAADRFDPERGVAFSTYASRTVVGELKHHLRDHAWILSTPRSLKDLYLEVEVAIGELTNRLSRAPTVREIAAACSRREEQVIEAIEAGRSYSAVSLEAMAESGTETIESSAIQPVATEGDGHDLMALVTVLAPRDREIVRLRFVEDLSQSAIAERLGISQMHVSRRLRVSLEALRDAAREG